MAEIQRDIDKFYETNEDFKEYIDKVAMAYHTTVTYALSMAIVKEVYRYYAER